MGLILMWFFILCVFLAVVGLHLICCSCSCGRCDCRPHLPRLRNITDFVGKKVSDRDSGNIDKKHDISCANRDNCVQSLITSFYRSGKLCFSEKEILHFPFFKSNNLQKERETGMKEEKAPPKNTIKMPPSLADVNAGADAKHK